MRRLREFALSVEIAAGIEEVWKEMVAWKDQSEWMLATRVYDDESSPEGVGHKLKAYTGIAPRRITWLGVMDHMVVSVWEPPTFCRVEHVGTIIKGYGTFTLVALDENRTRFDWFEEIKAPAIVLAVIKPGVLIGVKLSLARFARRFVNR